MSETKFTEGEWSIEISINQMYITSSFDGNNKAICAVSAYGCHDNSIREANSQLIAAARDNYYAAMGAIEILEKLGLESSDEYQALLASTKKSRGEK